MTVRLSVECYAGRTADERPVRFQLDGHSYIVESVLDQWYGPEGHGTHFYARQTLGETPTRIIRVNSPNT